ncbi:uncharacterized protein PpBr36_06544 [Pyricularia pennisetigena]|uniref:uncharacterized protein n=1 Tax=Pyricularia pennisetigena TaxID=1578925 RepID=UPI00114EB530|nr:uncharacterized protein PpBr36_06544 [Pyricularia pennisetigena]TLS23473.1 hypothetical protein PpBr36_06544 [Pyricularia pennisetigena]
MVGFHDLDLPIALRRTRRIISGPHTGTAPSCTVQTNIEASSKSTNQPCSLSSDISPTPRKKNRRPRKQVRFSDPGPILDTLQNEDHLSSTGLTPMVKKTSLGPIASSRRRHSTPAKSSSSLSRNGLDLYMNQDSLASPLGGDVRLLPLRQVLDGRVKRRLRRNGLSEEMNAIHAEKKKKAAEAKAELQRLRDDLSAKDAEISQLRAVQQQQHWDAQHQDLSAREEFDPDATIDTVVGDTERIFDLEREVASLRQQLHDRTETTIENTRSYEWTLAARDPFALGEYSMMDIDDDDDEQFGDATIAELQCSTPSSRRAGSRKNANEAAAASFPSPPATSPLARGLQTPSSLRFCSIPELHIGVQASLPDPEKQQLEEELASLQMEVSKLTAALQSYQSLATRVSNRMSRVTVSTTTVTTPEAITDASPEPAIEARLSDLLTTVSDRTAALSSLSASITNLGFPGSDAGEMLISMASAFRTARLELEYLTPGEITLPLSSAGAAVLDLLLARLRDLSKRAREDEAAIDEYHAQELSLRQQLSARVDVSGELAAEVQNLKKQLEDRDAKVDELQVGLDRLKGAAASYTRDIAELEKLTERVEAQRIAALDECELLRGAATTKDAEMDEARRAHDAAVTELQGKLATLLAGAGDLRVRLANAEADAAGAQIRHADRTKKLNIAHGRQLALRDARVAELRIEVDRVNSALRAAHDTVCQLRVEKGRLEGRVEDEKAAAKKAVDAMKEELERVVQMSREFLASTPKDKDSEASSWSRSARYSRTPSARKSQQSDGMPATVVRPGGLFDAAKTRRRSSVGEGDDASLAVAPEDVSAKGKKRRRYDSGLGFLDEEDVDF